ncbi:hypothetical protein [Thalassotalea agarivorans]|nr:hypothetical protein [Thalassotalea agarivorans]
MKKILVVLFLALISVMKAHASTCNVKKHPDKSLLSITVENNVRHFSIPAEFEGKPLDSIVIWVFPKSGDTPGELAIPITFEIEGKIAKGQFSVSGNFVNLEFLAMYYNGLCGPRLETEIGI